jgi:hypothetical protein
LPLGKWFRVGQCYNLFFSNIRHTDLLSSDATAPLPNFENFSTILTAIGGRIERNDYI